MSIRTSPSGQPIAFRAAVAEIRAARWRPEVIIEEIPSPQRIAPFSLALSADVAVAGDDVGSGRLVLLHDPAGNDAWEGTFRCVTFAKADVDKEMVVDPMLGGVGWSWLIDALDLRGASYVQPSGTVTSVASESFGGRADEPGRAEVEIRASWTPVLDGGQGMLEHLMAWQDLLCMTAGLPPLPEGVTPIAARRGR